MKLQEIDQGVFVCGQLTVDFVDELAQQGFKTIVCNRPDGEEPDQPSFAVIEQRARKHNIKVFFIPVTPLNIEKQNIDDMHMVLANCDYPLVAYCKTGGRATALYQLAKE